MKLRLHFRIAAKLRNSKGQHCSWQEKYIHINLKKPVKEKKKERQKGQGSLLFAYEPQGTLHMLRGLNVDAHFGKPSRKKKPSNMGEKELVSG